MLKISVVASGLMLIAVITVLAIVGIKSTLATQAQARDTKRLADINAIATTLEVNYDDQLGKYVALVAQQFQGDSIPRDPLSDSGTNCKKDSLPQTPPTPCHYCVGGYSSRCKVIGPGVLNDVARWEICTALEKGNTYCRFSSR